MGDRANIVVTESGQRIYLYAHNHGEELPVILQTAMKRRQRWDDAPYLTRIIFCQMVKGDEAGETGFGISTSMGDNDGYPLLIVDVDQQQIRLEPESGPGPNDKSMSFEQFVALPSADWLALGHNHYGDDED